MHSVVVIHVINDRTADKTTGTTEEAPVSRERTKDTIRRSVVIHQGVGQANRGWIQSAPAREIDAGDTSPRARLVDVGTRGDVGDAPTIGHVGCPWIQLEAKTFDEVVLYATCH